MFALVLSSGKFLGNGKQEEKMAEDKVVQQCVTISHVYNIFHEINFLYRNILLFVFCFCHIKTTVKTNSNNIVEFLEDQKREK